MTVSERASCQHAPAHSTLLQVLSQCRRSLLPSRSCGYISIGCEPCTRPVLPNQQEREGRWWWEDSAAKECGLHSGNKGYAEGAKEGEEKKAERDLWDKGAVQGLDKKTIETLAGGNRDKDTLVVLYAPWCRFCQGERAGRGLFEAVLCPQPLDLEILAWKDEHPLAYDLIRRHTLGAPNTKALEYLLCSPLSSPLSAMEPALIL